MRQITNGQLSLEQSAQRLCSRVKSIIKDLALDEQESMRKYPRLAQIRPFEQLRYNISIYTIKLLKKEWFNLQQLLNADIPLGDCYYKILLRYGIPCKYYLLRGYYSGEPLPRSLLYPR